MADLVPFTGGQIPPEMEAEALAIQRRKQVAQALQDQSLQSMKTQTVGDRVVRNTTGEGMTQIGKALIAAFANRSIDQQQRQLATDYQKGLSQAVQNYGSRYSGTRGQLDPQEMEQRADQGTPLPFRTEPDPKGAIRDAMMSGYGPVRDLGKMEYGFEKARELERERTHTVPAGGSISRDGNIIATAPDHTRTGRADHSLPADWMGQLEKEVGKGKLTRMDNDPPGVFRMEGTDKQKDVYSGKFEDGKLVGYAKLDTSQKIDARTINGLPVRPTTIQDPKNPNATLVVDANNPKTVIGAGPKLTEGGTQERKLKLAMPQAKLHVGTIGQNLDRLDVALSSLHDDPGLTNITGTLMGRTPNVTNKATGAQGTLNMIKSNIFQSSLQAMREASKTGGAVGNVSDKEGDKLERTIAALDQAQGTSKFKEQLKAAAKQVQLSKVLIQNAYTEQYGHLEENESDIRGKADAILGGGK